VNRPYPSEVRHCIHGDRSAAPPHSSRSSSRRSETVWTRPWRSRLSRNWGRSWVTPQLLPLLVYHGHHGAAPEVDQVPDKGVRVLRLDVELVERRGREVLEVDGDDRLCSGPYGCSQDVAVIGVRKLKALDEVLVAGDQAVRNGLAHQLAGARQLLAAQVCPSFLDRAEGLVEDPLGPPGVEQLGLGQADQEVAQRRRVKDTRVEDDSERQTLTGPSVLVPHAQLVSLVGQLVCGSPGLPVRAGLVGEEIPDRDPTTVADAPVRHGPLVEQTYQVGP